MSVRTLTKKTTAINFLLAFATGDTWKDMYMPSTKTSINQENGSLKRVFNDGRGCLVVAQKTEKIVYFNSILLSKKERLAITKELDKDTYLFVELGYPRYYEHNLISLHKKYGNECIAK
jgi:hypothetical protein